MADHQRSFAVVAGGSSGIGFELARQFLATGFDVLIGATGRPVDALRVNAGFRLGGSFADTALKRELWMIDINVRAPCSSPG